jgi:hypothetical protein
VFPPFSRTPDTVWAGTFGANSAVTVVQRREIALQWGLSLPHVLSSAAYASTGAEGAHGVLYDPLPLPPPPPLLGGTTRVCMGRPHARCDPQTSSRLSCVRLCPFRVYQPWTAGLSLVNTAVSGRRFGAWFRWVKLHVFDGRNAPATMLPIYAMAAFACDLEVRVLWPPAPILAVGGGVKGAATSLVPC